MDIERVTRSSATRRLVVAPSPGGGGGGARTAGTAATASRGRGRGRGRGGGGTAAVTAGPVRGHFIPHTPVEIVSEPIQVGAAAATTSTGTAGTPAAAAAATPTTTTSKRAASALYTSGALDSDSYTAAPAPPMQRVGASLGFAAASPSSARTAVVSPFESRIQAAPQLGVLALPGVNYDPVNMLDPRGAPPGTPNSLNHEAFNLEWTVMRVREMLAVLDHPVAQFLQDVGGMLGVAVRTTERSGRAAVNEVFDNAAAIHTDRFYREVPATTNDIAREVLAREALSANRHAPPGLEDLTLSDDMVRVPSELLAMLRDQQNTSIVGGGGGGDYELPNMGHIAAGLTDGDDAPDDWDAGADDQASAAAPPQAATAAAAPAAAPPLTVPQSLPNGGAMVSDGGGGGNPVSSSTPSIMLSPSMGSPAAAAAASSSMRLSELAQVSQAEPLHSNSAGNKLSPRSVARAMELAALMAQEQGANPVQFVRNTEREMALLNADNSLLLRTEADGRTTRLLDSAYLRQGGGGGGGNPAIANSTMPSLSSASLPVHSFAPTTSGGGSAAAAAAATMPSTVVSPPAAGATRLPSMMAPPPAAAQSFSSQQQQQASLHSRARGGGGGAAPAAPRGTRVASTEVEDSRPNIMVGTGADRHAVFNLQSGFVNFLRRFHAGAPMSEADYKAFMMMFNDGRGVERPATRRGGAGSSAQQAILGDQRAAIEAFASQHGHRISDDRDADWRLLFEHLGLLFVRPAVRAAIKAAAYYVHYTPAPPSTRGANAWVSAVRQTIPVLDLMTHEAASVPFKHLVVLQFQYARALNTETRDRASVQLGYLRQEIASTVDQLTQLCYDRSRGFLSIPGRFNAQALFERSRLAAARGEYTAATGRFWTDQTEYSAGGGGGALASRSLLQSQRPQSYGYGGGGRNALAVSSMASARRALGAANALDVNDPSAPLTLEEIEEARRRAAVAARWM